MQARQHRAAQAARPVPRKKSWSTLKVMLVTLLGIFLFWSTIIILAGVAATADPAASASPQAASSAAPDAPLVGALPGIGEPARDGNFEFVVLDVENPGKRYNPDDGLFYSEADGTWLIVRVSVTNIGDERESFSGSDQLLYWGNLEYSPSFSISHATIYESLNPGVSFVATIMYDVPPSFPKLGSGTLLELHDSMFSGGVEIGL